MNLYLLRHGIAVERDTPGFEIDRLRPLTADGRAKMEQIATAMRALGLKFDVLLTSPFVRALQTAEIAAAALGQTKRLQPELTLQADRSPQEFLVKLVTKFVDQESVLVVGHEPFLSALASTLLGLPGGSALVMKKGGLCKLTVTQFKPRPIAQLEWLLTPKQLRAIAV